MGEHTSQASMAQAPNQANMQQQAAQRNRFKDPNYLTEAFYHFDREGQGRIETDEIIGIIQNNGKRMRQEEIDEFRAEAIQTTLATSTIVRSFKSCWLASTLNFM